MNARLSAAALVIAIVFSSCASSSDADRAASAVASTSLPASAVEAESPPAMATAVAPEPATTPNPALSTCRGDAGGFTVGRTDLQPTGNRVAPGAIDLLNAPIATTELPAAPSWIVPYIEPDDACEAHWYVTLEDGRAVIVDAAGEITGAGPAAVPPETSPGTVASALADLDQFENPLPDSRVVRFGRWKAALVDPTERYGHGVLGDRIEAGAVEIVDTASGERTRIVIEAPTVIEGISPMFLEVDHADDAIPEILVTLSNSDDGAWLALYTLDGTLRARSDAIGRGNRWRNQLGAAGFGLPGRLEIVDVRTPHLDGVIEFFTVVGDRLERVATTTGYTSHVIGSRNLDMGILLDADADKLVEVVVPTRDLGSLAVIDRIGNDAVELGRIDLGGSLNTNISGQWLVGQAWLAVGTKDGRLLVFGDPSR